MLHNTNVSPESYPNDEWSSRCEYWKEQSAIKKPNRKRRERQSAPLILTGLGLSIRVDKGTLLVTDGTTHFPSSKVEHRFFKGALERPSRIVVVDGYGNISLDAIDWMAEQGIAFIRIKYDGKHVTAISLTGYAADPDKVAWQWETRRDPAKQLEFAVKITTEKLDASLVTLRDHLPPSDNQIKAIGRLRLAWSS